MTEKIAGVGDEAVVNATGAPWEHWLRVLDDREGTNLDHKGRVSALVDAGVDSGWWRQTIAVGYEQERGLREVGETTDAGFQIGVQRTLSIAQEQLWDRLFSSAGVGEWLGEVEGFSIEPGSTYETSDGTVGEIRTVSAGERLRLTWQPADRDRETTLQLRLTPSSTDEDRTVLRVHHEKLDNTTERESMREHWRSILDRLEASIESP